MLSFAHFFLSFFYIKSNLNMMRVISQTLLSCNLLKSSNLLLYRYIRSIGRRGTGPKLIEGKVKTVTNFEDTSLIETYDDYVDSYKKSKLGDELQVEKDFIEEDDLGHAAERCEHYYDMYLRKEKSLKASIKKQIIKRKYFKLEKETCLLTHAAKEQIRFLHMSNPLEWNCKILSECFPISEAGVKKLLKSNFTLTDPEKIKAHDKDVAEKWEILKSGKPTTFIAPQTYQLYKEGKIVNDHFSGNPNLPTASPNVKELQVEKRTHTGEFSAIVETYAAYGKQKLLDSSKDSSGNQVTLRDTPDVEINKRAHYKDIRKFKYASEEFDNTKKHTSYRNYENKNNTDLPLSQFKEILKEEAKYKTQKDDIISLEENILENETFEKPDIVKNCFLKISKYNRNENINGKYDQQNNVKVVYTYDEKLGYQYPVGKTVKGKIHLSTKYKKGKLYKVGQCVYDDDGELLYKVPA